MNHKPEFLHFLEHDAGEEYQKSLLALDQFYHDNRQQLVKDCTEAWITFFHTICQQQSQGKKQNIAYIYASFLYTSLQAGQDLYRFDAYDQDWFFDPLECTGDYQTHWAYRFLHELGERLLEKSKKYMGQITSYDIERLQRLEACKFGVYVDAVAHEAIKAAVKSPEFAAISKEDILEIFIGEYKDQCRTLYCHDSRTKDNAAITKQIVEKIKNKFVFAVWEHLAFTDLSFDQTDLRYVRFTGSTIENTTFDQALLWGADLSHTQITNTRFVENEMPGADFSHAQLLGSHFLRVDAEPCGLEREPYIGTILPANFYKAELKQVHFNEVLLQQVNFQEATLSECDFSRCEMKNINFQGATLEHCTFSSVDLREADFRGAVITACDASTSDLAGALFSAGTDIDQLGLTSEQQVTFL